MHAKWLVIQLGKYGNEEKESLETCCVEILLVLNVCVCILVISTRCQRTVPLPIKGLRANWPHHGIQRIRILGLASFMVDLVEGHLLRLLLPGIPTKYSWCGRCDRKVSHSLIFVASNFKLPHTFLVPPQLPKAVTNASTLTAYGFDFLPIFKVQRQPLQLWRKHNSLEDGRTMQAPSTYPHVRSSLRPK